MYRKIGTQCFFFTVKNRNRPVDSVQLVSLCIYIGLYNDLSCVPLWKTAVVRRIISNIRNDIFTIGRLL